jgi:toxin ParE1/3/4
LQIQWSNQAAAQLEAAYDFIWEENPPEAEKLLETIRRAVKQLADFPEMGRPGRVDGTRELVIQSTPYIVTYRSKGNTVRILAALHGARRWPTGF